MKTTASMDKGRKEQLCVQIGMLDTFMENEASAKLE